jgi:hypothetical protein
MKKNKKKHILRIWLLCCLLLTSCGKTTGEHETKILTLAVMESKTQLRNSNLLQWVNQYNEKYSDVQIEIVNYLDNYPDPEEALNQIKIEINAGKGPDMINFGSQYSPLDASTGMMTDLYPLMQDDESFDRQDYYYNIMDAFAVDKSLYVIVPSFRIESYATSNEQLAGMEGMNVKQLKDAYNMLDEDSILFPGETKKSVFGMICYGSMENYIDWDSGTCNFNGESFKEILHFSNSFPLNLNIDEDYSAKKIFTEGKALLYPVSIDNVYGETAVRMLYGETPTYIGYPVDFGCGSMADIANIAIGICATSQNKKEAWDFCKSLLDSEFQDNISRGLPLCVSSMKKELENAMRAEYDENGEKIAKDCIYFEGEEPVNIYEITEEDAKTLESIIRKIRYNATVDYNLYNILLEETDYLFNEDRNIDDVAEIIQNRVSLYINERK